MKDKMTKCKPTLHSHVAGAMAFALALPLAACSVSASELRPPSILAVEAETVDWVRDLVDAQRGPFALRQLATRVAPDFQLSRRDGDLEYARVEQISASTSHWAAVVLEDAGQPAEFAGQSGEHARIDDPGHVRAHSALLLLNENGTPVWLFEHEDMFVDVIDADGDGLREEALVRGQGTAGSAPVLAIYDLRETPPAPMFVAQFDLCPQPDAADAAESSAPAWSAGNSVVVQGGGAWQIEACTPETNRIVLYEGPPEDRRVHSRVEFVPGMRVFAPPGTQAPVHIDDIEPSPWTRLHTRGPHSPYRGRNYPRLAGSGPGAALQPPTVLTEDLR